MAMETAVMEVDSLGDDGIGGDGEAVNSGDERRAGLTFFFCGDDDEDDDNDEDEDDDDDGKTDYNDDDGDADDDADADDDDASLAFFFVVFTVCAGYALYHRRRTRPTLR